MGLARQFLPHRPKDLSVLDFRLMAKISRLLLGLLSSLGLLSIKSFAVAEEANSASMVWIPGGTFTMGSNLPGSHRNEQPPHQVAVDGFWIDKQCVTNAEFREFVEANGYMTTAERPVDWEELKKKVPLETPKPPDEMTERKVLRREAKTPVLKLVTKFRRRSSSTRARKCSSCRFPRRSHPSSSADVGRFRGRGRG